MESLLGYILLENSAIQRMDAEGGPNDLTAAHERVTKLVWKLKQIDSTNPTFIQAWNMLVDYGERDLRAMLLYHAITAVRDYTYAFSRLKVKIDLAIGLLSIQPQKEANAPMMPGVPLSLWHSKQRKE